MTDPLFHIEKLHVSMGGHAILHDVSVTIPRGGVFGLLGPSGAGKSTLLKCLNRLAELTPGAKITGSIRLNGREIHHRSVDPDALRLEVGILFQQPVVFPTSILRNVTFGPRHLRRPRRAELEALAEHALREAALWDEVKDRLSLPAGRLSIGQQQRLCLARTLACDPKVILMDEPTSALDAASTDLIEALVERLKKDRTIILVTHNSRQAERLCDRELRLEGGRVQTAHLKNGNPATSLAWTKDGLHESYRVVSDNWA